MAKKVNPAAGYSGTPLAKKLGMAEGTHLMPLDAPPDYRKLLAPMPDQLVFDNKVSAETDIVHVFVTRKAALAKQLKALRRSVRSDAAIWVSWPKKSSKVETDITEDVIRELALPLGLVDIKVCAVNEVWSGLKLAIRKELRASAASI